MFGGVEFVAVFNTHLALCNFSIRQSSMRTVHVVRM